MENNQIVKIDHTEFGIEEAKATQIAEMFKPMLDKMVELEKEYNEVIKIPIDDPEACYKASELRKRYVKVRTGTAEIHKQQKAFYLSAGRFIDGWKNAQLFASEGIEKKLQAIEKHYENLENERIAKLNDERMEELRKYDVDGTTLGLGIMNDDVWTNFLSGTKLNFEAKKAEAERLRLEAIEKEKAEAEERERVRLENERLKAENEAKEKQLEQERAEAKRKEDEAKAKADAERKEVERLAKIEADKQAQILAEEKAKSEKLQAELKAKSDAEAKVEADRIEADRLEKERQKAALKAPDKEKLTKWVDEIMIGLTPQVGGDAHKMALDIHVKFQAFQKWAKEQIKTL